MSKMIQIQWTSENIEEAKKIATELLEKRWIACANFIAPIESLYVWEGKICHAQEVKVFFKTQEAFFKRILKYIAAEASYDLPEVSKIEIAEGNAGYIEWVHQSTEEKGEMKSPKPLCS